MEDFPTFPTFLSSIVLVNPLLCLAGYTKCKLEVLHCQNDLSFSQVAGIRYCSPQTLNHSSQSQTRSQPSSQPQGMVMFKFSSLVSTQAMSFVSVLRVMSETCRIQAALKNLITSPHVFDCETATEERTLQSNSPSVCMYFLPSFFLSLLLFVYRWKRYKRAWQNFKKIKSMPWKVSNPFQISKLLSQRQPQLAFYVSLHKFSINNQTCIYISTPYFKFF